MFFIDYALLFESTLATLFMVFIAGGIAFFLGIPIAVGLIVTEKDGFLANKFIHKLLSIFVTLGRSVPFIILMIAIIPLTRFLVGTSIGTKAAIVPLAFASVPYFARIVEGKFTAIGKDVIEAAQAMGMSPLQIIFKVMIPEAFPGIVNAITILLVSLTEYSAMAGSVGGSGLGNMAIQYGYYQFNTIVMIEALIALLLLVLIIQFSGDFLAKKISKK